MPRTAFPATEEASSTIRQTASAMGEAGWIIQEADSVTGEAVSAMLDGNGAAAFGLTA